MPFDDQECLKLSLVLTDFGTQYPRNCVVMWILPTFRSHFWICQWQCTGHRGQVYKVCWHTSLMPGISMSGISSMVQQYDSFFTKLPSRSWYAQNSSSSYTVQYNRSEGTSQPGPVTTTRPKGMSASGRIC